jgi:hypothetical protein
MDIVWKYHLTPPCPSQISVSTGLKAAVTETPFPHTDRLEPGQCLYASQHREAATGDGRFWFPQRGVWRALDERPYLIR